MSSNVEIKVNGDDLKRLEIALGLHPSHREAVGYSETIYESRPSFNLHWTHTNTESYCKFPVKIGPSLLAPMVLAWVRDQQSHPSMKDSYPDIDGDVSIGWEVRCEYGNSTAGGWTSYLSVVPTWIEYGK